MKKAILTCLLVFLVSLAFAGIELQSNPKSQLSSFNEKHPNISSNRELYWDQISNPSGDGVIAAQDFINPTNDPYDCWGADDFEVGAGEVWYLSNIEILGGFWNGPGGPGSGFGNLMIYSDNAGMPGTELYNQAACSVVDDAVSNLFITLNDIIVLTEGVYWLVWQYTADFGVTGQWGWQPHIDSYGAEFYWINPGGGFGSGTGWISSLVQWPTFIGHDLCFALYGPDPEVEPNETWDTASEIIPNGLPGIGEISNSADTDFWFFTFGARDDVTIICDAGLGSLDQKIWLIDTDGTTVLASSDVGFAGGIEEIVYALDPGTYYIRVAYYANSPTPRADNGPYLLTVTTAPAGYCTASGITEDEYISNVLVGDINNDSMWEGYADFTGLSTNMVPGMGYPITVTGTGTYSDDELGIWVDWNQNMDFYDDDPIAVTGTPGYGPYTATITPPLTALGGPTRMRIRLTWFTTPDPCGDDLYGEVEDYTVNVLTGYCDASGGNDEYIDGIEVGTISNLGTGYTTGYEDFTYLSTDVIPGVFYDLTIYTGNSYSSDDYGLWVDWNDDLDFDDPDENPICFGDVGAAINIFNFQVSPTAPVGPHRARIRLKWSGVDCGLPCGVTSYGEVEDYTFNVVIPSEPEFSVTPDSWDFGTILMPGVSDPVTFTVMNTGGGVLTISNVEIFDITRASVNFYYDLGTDVLPANLNTGESITIDVYFEPDTPGYKTAQMEITDNLTRTINVVPLSGRGFLLPTQVCEIGDGAITGTGLPVEPNYGYTYSQVIYLNEQIGTPPGTIPAIAYHYYAYDNFEDTNDIVIYMAHTTKAAFSSTSDWVPYAELTEVFNGTWDITAGTGWVLIALDTPFVYNGTDNIVIAVDENRPAYDSGSDEFYCTTVPTYQGLRYYSDGTNPNPMSPPSGTRKYNIANVRLYGIEKPTGFIAGNVSEEIYRGPIENAHIVATGTAGTFETYTNASGDYNMEVPLPVGLPGFFTVTCSADGYLPEEVDVEVNENNTTVVDFILDVYLLEPTGLMATGWDGHVDLDWMGIPNLIVSEDFEAGIPGDWPVINNGGDCVWSTCYTVGRPNYTGGSGDAATADSDKCGSGTTMDTELRTPEYPVTRTDLTLFFRASYNNFSSDHFAVDISTDSGSNWTNILYWAEDHDPYGREDININLTPYLTGATSYIIRWHYVAPGWYWWVQIDDVMIFSEIVLTRALNGYKVYRGTESGVYGYLGSTTQSNYTDNTVVNGTEYFYAVTATYDEGPYESIYSNEASVLPQAARVIEYYEDFEENDGEYQVINGEWEWGELPSIRWPGSVPSGTKLWGTDLDDSYTANVDHVLQTVPFDLSGESLIYMEFEHWYQLYSTTSCVIGIDEDNDGVYVPVPLGDVSGDSEDWEHYVFQVPPGYLTDYVKFAFILDAGSYVPTSDHGWYLDDVMLYDPIDHITFPEDLTAVVDYSNFFGPGLSITVTPSAEVTGTVVGDVVTYSSLIPNWFGDTVIHLLVEDAARSVLYDKDVMVHVTPVNDAPTIALPDEIHFDEDTDYVEDFSPYINDVDGDPLILTVVPPVNIDVDIAGFVVTMTNIVENWNGNENVTFRVNDQGGRLIGQDIVNIVVDPVNDLPIVLNPVPDVVRNEDFGTYTVGNCTNIFFDPDNALDYSVDISDPTIVSVSLNGTNVVLTSILNQYTITPLVLTITASESGGRDLSTNSIVTRSKAGGNLRDSVVEEVLVTINPVNDVPTISLPPSFTFPEEGSLVVDFTPYLNDVDGDDLLLTSNGSAHIDVDIVDFMVTFSSPTLNWYGSESVSFTVNDQQGRLIATGSTVVIVTPVNDPPTIDIPADFTFAEGGSLFSNFAPFVNDVDGNPLTLSVAGNVNVQVVIAGLNVTFSTYDPLWYGEEVLTFTVSDGVARATASDVTTVHVTYVNHPPQYVGPTYINLMEDFGIHTIGNMFDLFIDIDPPEFTNLTFELVSFNANKLNAYIDGSDDLIIESVQDANGLSTVRVKAFDNDSYPGTRSRLSTIQDIQIDMTPVNDPPILFNLPAEIDMAANSIQFLNLENNWSDVDDENPVMDIFSPPGFVEIIKLEGYDYRFRISALGLFDMSDYITVSLDDGHARDVVSEDILVNIAASLPPYVTFMIPNQQFEEDFDLTYIINLDECFDDPDDEFLNYGAEVLTLVDDNPVIQAQIDEENGFWLGSSLPDWFGIAYVRVDCWDRVDNRFTVSQTIGVIVLPVNDPPVVVQEIADIVLDEDFGTYDVADLYDIFSDVDDEVLFFTAVPVVPGIFQTDPGGSDLSLNSLADMYGSSDVVVTANDGHGRAIATTDFNVMVNDIYDYPTWNNNIQDGDVFIFDLDGELLDLTGCVNTHNQFGNTVPIGYDMIPIPNVDGDCYDIIPSENPLYGLIVTPIGYQPDMWHILYPDQLCNLILDGGDVVQVLLRTNMSPYIVAMIPDTWIDILWGWYDYVDLDNYFADPEGGTLTYTAIFDPDEIIVGIEPDNMLGFDDCAEWWGFTDITIVAEDHEARATASQTFTVQVCYGTRSLEEDKDLPKELPQQPEVFVTALGANFPNPFNPATTIAYSLETAGCVELSVYNMKGQKIRTLVSANMTAGNHQVLWDGKDDHGIAVGSGIYFSKLVSGDYQSMRKMILMK